MKYLYNFGITQDDVQTERKALDIKDGDHLICIASAGEVPLNLLSCSDVHINAVDISQSQLHLSRLKMAAAIHFEPEEAARFIGYFPCRGSERMRLFRHIARNFTREESYFWREHSRLFVKGPIHLGRFERYLSMFNWLGLRILGKRKVRELLDFENVEAQRDYFDQHIDSKNIRFIFNLAFHPKIYKNRGMDAQGLRFSGERNIAAFFFGRFRSFCTSTLARENYFLQLSLFNRILFKEALPEYLMEPGIHLLRARKDQLTFNKDDISEHILKYPEGYFNKYALSNIGDWISKEEYFNLMRNIGDKAPGESKILLRYIHYPHSLPENLRDTIHVNSSVADVLESMDRYPFYSLIPMYIQRTSGNNEGPRNI